MEVHLKHFHHLGRLNYLLNLCRVGEVAHPFATNRIDFQRGDTVIETVAVIFFILGRVNDANNAPSKGSLLCIWVIFLSEYHFYQFAGLQQV